MASVSGPCEYDFDCATSLICYPASVTWTGTDDNVCLHVGYYVDPFSGERNATTYYLILVCVLQVLVASVVFSVGVRDIGRSIYVFGRKLRWNATTKTTLTATFAALFHALWQLCMLGTTLNQDTFDKRTSDNDDAEKLGRFSLVQRPMIFLCIMFMVFAALQVSVLWVEIAQHSRRMNAVTVHGVKRYRMAVVAFELVFAASMLPVAMVGVWSLSIPVAFPFILAIGITFAVGRARMMHLLRDTLTSFSNDNGKLGQSPSLPSLEEKRSPDSPQSRSNPSAGRALPVSAARRTRKVMKVIERTSLQVTIGLFSVLLAGLLYFLLDFEGIFAPAGGRQFMTPKLSIVTVFQMFINISLLYIIVFIQSYAHRSTAKIVNRELRIQKGQNLSSSDNNEISSIPDDGSSFAQTLGSRTQVSFHAGTPGTTDDAADVFTPAPPPDGDAGRKSRQSLLL
ncbi:Hypothetical Protein FCC1311_024252 [Hondaea fermentalgiana]|uniref:Uncharacterized protein n=1 Tax=Hondaea fermentalgiana TaxID=2315210 RepID=A0A2R5GEF7_9STRA|nr:Hypothetical Protein FCC1311_024252 [Hondaea fermentalgiana]|eukprot:GBG26204.1 Hypothetical Protein FCC1311_024252 [Hondaea fermentalgiana]